MKALARHVAQLQRLTYLSFYAHERLEEQALDILADMLVKLPTLQTFNSKAARMCSRIVPQLSSFTALRSLEVLANSEHHDLAQHLACMTNLTHLNIHDVEVIDMQQLAPELAKLSALQNLDISDSLVSNEWLKVSLRHISSPTSLKALSLLDSNSFDGKDMVGMVKQLHALPCTHVSIGRKYS